jgi:enoyl-CoA hydratase/carnithine racemase
MVHLPWAVNIGNAASMRRAADQLDTLTTPIVNVYKQQVKGRIREAKIRALMEAETWMTAEEALDYGFVDKVRGSIKALAKASPFALLVNDEIMDVGKYHYRNLPDYPLVDEKESAEYQMIERERKRESMVEDKPITRETLPPGVVAQIQEEARQEERGRLAALDAMRMPGLEELIEAAKKDGRQPADIVMEAFNLIREERGRDEVVAAMHRDGSFNLRAGDAPMNKVEDKNQRAVNLMVEAFAKNGRRTK